MQNAIKAALFALVLALATPLAAQDFEAGLEAYERGDYAAALSEWRPLAEHGNAEAQYKLGLMYDDGHGVAYDFAEAAQWFRTAAEQGHGTAQNNLGVIYFNGLGMSHDYVQAHMWWTLAASQGNPNATNNHNLVAGMMTPEQIAEAQILAHQWKSK